MIRLPFVLAGSPAATVTGPGGMEDHSMGLTTPPRTLRVIPFLVVVCVLGFPAQAKYTGGSGTADDPYQIATAEDLMLLGDSPEDYDKRFILTADIDLSGYTFDRAVIAGDTGVSQWYFEGVPFIGVFAGSNHVIRSLHIEGEKNLGLFGRLGSLAVVSDLGLENASIQAERFPGSYVGGLVGANEGTIANCYSTGTVTGDGRVGGLIGDNHGSVSNCYSTGDVTGHDEWVGGLVGYNDGNISNCYSTGQVTGQHWWRIGGLVGASDGWVWDCYSTGTVTGDTEVGGLIGSNGGWTWDCYSAGTVTGDKKVGGLAGRNHYGYISNCCSTGDVTGDEEVGGLAAYNYYGSVSNSYSMGAVTGNNHVGGLVGRNRDGVVSGFWDTEISGLATSDGGAALTTTEMQEMDAYLNAGWDFAGENANGTAETWQMPQGGGYPQLSVFAGYEPILHQGRGTMAEPFLVTNAQELGSMRHYPLAHYRLDADIDLMGITWSVAPVPSFGGHFDGNGHVVRHLHIQGGDFLGLFGSLEARSVATDLGVADSSVQGERFIGSLAGWSGATLMNCYSTGAVTAEGWNVGGFVGVNVNSGSMANCYSTASVTGDGNVGGLVGLNQGSIANCYSIGAVTWNSRTTGMFSGESHVGGLVGYSPLGAVVNCRWDRETSGRAASVFGGLGLTTAKMHEMDTYVRIGWDFLGESANGTTETWQMPQAGGYPRLSVFEGHEPVLPQGQGTLTEPFLITNAEDLGSAAYRPLAYYRLDADIDLLGITWPVAVIPLFGGHFDGNGHVIRHLRIRGGEFLGLFGYLAGNTVVSDLGLENASIQAEGVFADYVGSLGGYGEGTVVNCYSNGVVAGTSEVGGLIGYNYGSVSNCHTSGEVIGEGWNTFATGGLVGDNEGSISNCHSTGTVAGSDGVGGLVGDNDGDISNCYGTGAVTGREAVGGLVGHNMTIVSNSYSNGAVTGDYDVGGLAGENWGDISNCYSTGEVIGEGWEPFTLGGLVGDNSGNLWNCWSAGAVTGNNDVGGLAGENWGDISNCYSTGTVTGGTEIGGLIGENNGTTWDCYSSGAVTGDYGVGGLVGDNWGRVTNCCSTGEVTGDNNVGGLIGANLYGGLARNCYSSGAVTGTKTVGGLAGVSIGPVSNCYSTGAVAGDDEVGGLIGSSRYDNVVSSFWDIETSGQTTGDEGAGLTTAEMQDVHTYLDAGWDFMGQVEDGVEDIWWIDDGRDYPRLSWQWSGIDAAVGVHRLWSGTHERHFYTIDESEKEQFLQDAAGAWVDEGVVYRAFAHGWDPNVVPVHRFFSESLNSHFYTISDSERDKLISDYPDVWTYEKIAFYVFPEGQQPPDTSPVYRFWSATSSSHFYTIDEEEKARVIAEYSDVWVYEGIAWYAYKP